MLMDIHPTLLIPAYQPDEQLYHLVTALHQLNPAQPILVINDGSDVRKKPLFTKLENLGIKILNHSGNRGKGQALKTGFQYWLQNSPATAAGVITADADGQHLPQDIVQIINQFNLNPHCLHLGVRQFNKSSIPWRSRLGNKLTKLILRFFTKFPIQDTQTGLRAIPRQLIHELLQTKTKGYDFELEMLLMAEKKQINIKEIAINTVYLDNNKSSHFNPLLDSIKIYFVFIRFAAISLVSAIIDFTLFSFTYWLKKNIFLAVLLGRILSASFNFRLNHQLAFKSKNTLFPAAIKYAMLANLLALVAYTLIKCIHGFGINVYSSKIIAEIALFILSFTIQRYYIFNKSELENEPQT